MYWRYEPPEGSAHWQLVVLKVLQKGMLEDLNEDVLGGILWLVKMIG